MYETFSEITNPCCWETSVFCGEIEPLGFLDIKVHTEIPNIKLRLQWPDRLTFYENFYI